MYKHLNLINIINI